MIALIVDLLCAFTAAACAVLLLRAYGRTRHRLLFWSGLAFAGFALNNALFTVDLAVPAVDLRLVRMIPALLGGAAMVYGLLGERQ